jgi:uncharacterized protein YndB with AHSA1/START domain
MKSLSLVVRRTIAASPARLFEAWTTPAQLVSWWGPKGVRCTHAEVDARAGGKYKIGNELPDGRVLWIAGEFLVVEPPKLLVYSWSVGEESNERVTVRFEPRGSGSETEVVIVHERIADEAKHDEHEHGWAGCLDGLAAFVASS